MAALQKTPLRRRALVPVLALDLTLVQGYRLNRRLSYDTPLATKMTQLQTIMGGGGVKEEMK